MLAKFFASACAAIAATAITASSLIAAPRPADDIPAGMAKPKPQLVNVKAVAKDNNAFALELFQELRKEQEGNLFFSPYSVSSALGMTYGGAKKDTAKGMEKALHLSLTGDSFHSSLGALTKQLETNATNNGYQLNVANQLWGEKAFKDFFLQSFLDLNQKQYGAKMETVDFKKSEAAAKTINEWVEKKTNKKIKDLVKKSMFENPTPTALVLTNAIYFKGDWATKFEKANTQSQDFFLNAKDSTKADLMYQQDNLLYTEDKEAQVLAIPYKGGSLQMVIILPTKKDGLSKLEDSLSITKLDGWVSSMFTEEVQVRLPKFKTESSFSLVKHLKKMGMQDAFNEKADFSGMADLEKLSAAMGEPSGLCISEVVHKSFVEVNEEGSEAAAATAVIVGVVSITSAKPYNPPKQFNANHPFLYLIRDTNSGAILFMGRMQNPKA